MLTHLSPPYVCVWGRVCLWECVFSPLSSLVPLWFKETWHRCIAFIASIHSFNRPVIIGYPSSSLWAHAVCFFFWWKDVRCTNRRRGRIKRYHRCTVFLACTGFGKRLLVNGMQPVLDLHCCVWYTVVKLSHFLNTTNTTGFLREDQVYFICFFNLFLFKKIIDWALLMLF